MHICQRASALLAYMSILSHAFRARFPPSLHHLKHTDLSLHIPFDPYLRTVLSPALVSSLIFTHTQSEHALDHSERPQDHHRTSNISCSRRQHDSRKQPPLFRPLPQSTSHSESLQPNLPLAIYSLRINSRRIWKPAGCVMILPDGPLSSMQMDS